MANVKSQTTEDAIEAGIEAASEAVSGMAMGQKAWGAKEFEIARVSARAAVAALRKPSYTLRRDDQGFAAAIERDRYTVLILATGAERNEQEAQAIVNALNRVDG